MISIIIPTLNESNTIEKFLVGLQPLRRLGHEVIVVDGESDDDTAEKAQPLADRVLTELRGRARQMNAGARCAGGDVLWFLHADCQPPDGADKIIIDALKNDEYGWGRFDVCLSGSGIHYRAIERLMNIRSRFTGIATGDQGIFVKQKIFDSVGGFPNIPLMEDIAISKRLCSIMRPACLKNKIITSSRRWQRRGIWQTILLMWRLRLAYAFGANPDKLAKLYR